MIKLALIGCGKWGKHYLKTLGSIAGCELRWVCDLDQQKLLEAVSDYPLINFTEDKEDILADSSVQGVVIATPPESHYPLAKECISRGKAVLVEKPVTMAQKDCIDLINLATAQNTVLMAGYTMLYHPSVRKIKELVAENNKLCYLNMARTNAVSHLSGVDVLHDLAVHDIYLSRYLVGEDPGWVIAQGESYVQGPHNNVIYILLGYPNGIIASIFASFIHTERSRKLCLVSTNAKLTFDDLLPVEKKIDLIINGQCNPPLIIEEYVEPLTCECLHFIECIVENKEPESGKKAIAFVAKITDYIIDSLAKGGEKVFIP